MAKIFTVAEQVDVLSKKLEVTQAQARKVLDAVREMDAVAVQEGQELRLSGIGTIYTKHYEARKGNNLHGEGTIDIPARKAFKLRTKAQAEA